MRGLLGSACRQSTAAGIVFAAGLMACAPLGPASSRTVDSGASVFSAGTEVAFASPRLSPDDEFTLPSLLPVAGYRRGFAGFDVGARAWGLGIAGFYSVGAGADVRVQLIDREMRRGRWELLGSVGGAYHQLNMGRVPTHLPHGELEAIAGRRFDSGDGLNFGLIFRTSVLSAEDVTTQTFVYSALTLGYDWRVRPNVALQPRLALGNSPVSFNGTIDDPDRTGLPVLQLALGIAWSPSEWELLDDATSPPALP